MTPPAAAKNGANIRSRPHECHYTMPDPNGTNLEPLWDAAPTGQMLLLPKTQGGAGTCPGLWDVAPLGLKLEPFMPDHFSPRD
jgi:hypothetical protein